MSALDLLASLVLEDGRSWGAAAAPWQIADARAILEPDVPHLHFLTRPRGGSKTSDLGAVAIAALLEQLPAGGRAHAFAASRDQAALLVDAIAGFASRTEGLAGALKVENYVVTAARTDARLIVQSADDASAWGLKSHLLIADELAQWPTTFGPRRLWHAITSTVPKVKGCRLVVLTTAGDPAHFSHRILTAAKDSESWRVHEVPGPVPWISPTDLEEQRRQLPESVYRRLHLNQWTASEDRLVDPEDLRACVTLDGALDPRSDCRYRIGVDLGLKHDRTAVAVCHAERDTAIDRPKVVLDRLLVWQGTRNRPVSLDLVESAVLEASRRYNGAPVTLDPWQAAGLMQRLSARGVRCHEFTFSSSSVGRLASTLLLQLRDRALALPDDPELIDELLNIRLRETSPGVLRIDHDAGRHDDRAIALALATLALVGQPASMPGVVHTAAITAVGALPGRTQIFRNEGLARRGGLTPSSNPWRSR